MRRVPAQAMALEKLQQKYEAETQGLRMQINQLQNTYAAAPDACRRPRHGRSQRGRTGELFDPSLSSRFVGPGECGVRATRDIAYTARPTTRSKGG